jgi:hypothetical protein
VGCWPGWSWWPGRCRPAPYRPGNLVPDHPPAAQAGQTRGVPKRAQEFVILFVPTFGGILYLLFGRACGQVRRTAAATRARAAGLCISAPAERRIRATSATL